MTSMVTTGDRRVALALVQPCGSMFQCTTRVSNTGEESLAVADPGRLMP